MTIEELAKKYMELCKTYGCTNVKSITPIEYKLQNCAINGTVELEVASYNGKTVTIIHTNQLSYTNNIQILKEI